MKSSLTTYQRGFAANRVVFDANLLSPSLTEALRRASLACAENQKTETGITDFICGLYLQYRTEIAHHFRGDLPALVSRNFPIHRFGHEGLMPKAVFDQVRPAGGAAEAISYSLKYSDELLRLLWLSVKLANAIGKDASLTDVVTALTLEREWTEELQRSGLTLSRVVADFDRDVGTVVFFAPVHTSEGWPTKMEFEQDEILLPPFILEVSTPSGRFQPVRSAKVKLNGNETVNIEWPDKPTSRLAVQLLALNKIEFELDGPPFGSVDVTVRGTLSDKGQGTR